MKWRTAWLIIGALGIVCLALILSVVYPFSTTDLEERPSVASEFDAGEPTAYEFSLTYTSDKGEYGEFTGVATENGEEYVTTVDEDSRAELYRVNRTAPLYRWYRYSSHTDFQYQREHALEDPRVELIAESREGDRYTLLTRSNASSEEQPGPLYPPGISGGPLEEIAYDRVSETSGRITYEPRNGWFEGSRESYRITDATGSVTVDRETATIVAAEVSWTRTAPVERYADYALGRILETAQERHTYSIEYTTTDVDLDSPDWVQRVRE